MMVLMGAQKQAWFFHKLGGGVIAGPISLVAPASAAAAAVSVFECFYHPLRDLVTVYDCLIASGRDTKKLPLPDRIGAGATAVSGWRLAEHGTPIGVATYAPPMTAIDGAAAAAVLFVRAAAPYVFYAGGDAFLWKLPTLAGNQRVLICRVGEAMAVACRNTCLMVPVGNCTSRIPTHMGAYVCEPAGDALGQNTWTIVRVAKRSERLYTEEEVAADAQPTQVPRSGVLRLLTQIAPPRAQPKQTVDEEGWVTPVKAKQPLSVKHVNRGAPARK